jgi:hypothetical protein
MGRFTVLCCKPVQRAKRECFLYFEERRKQKRENKRRSKKRSPVSPKLDDYISEKKNKRM